MSIFAISDLHLHLGINKPMDIFGQRWQNYVENIEANWMSIVSDDDLVLIPGDISWATYLNESIPDFAFIDKLPGKKIILKGNHDYYWTTRAKLDEFLTLNNFGTITFLHNDCFIHENTAICGTRGWVSENQGSLSKDDQKIINRELERLKLSIASAQKFEYDKMIVCLHYPIELGSSFWNLISEHKASDIVYGHLHNASPNTVFEGMHDNINVSLVSCDYLKFVPKIILKK